MRVRLAALAVLLSGVQPAKADLKDYVKDIQDAERALGRVLASSNGSQIRAEAAIQRNQLSKIVGRSREAGKTKVCAQAANNLYNIAISLAEPRPQGELALDRSTSMFFDTMSKCEREAGIHQSRQFRP